MTDKEAVVQLIPIDEVFLLWHVHEFGDGEDDEKLIGVYRTEDDAKAAIEHVGNQPGFVDHPEGFQICPYQLNSDNWTEGFFTVYPKSNSET